MQFIGDLLEEYLGYIGIDKRGQSSTFRAHRVFWGDKVRQDLLTQCLEYYMKWITMEESEIDLPMVNYLKGIFSG